MKSKFLDEMPFNDAIALISIDCNRIKTFQITH